MSISLTKNDQEYKWDIFISHASEDKEAVAKPLDDLLRKKGLDVWLDEYQITLGDDFQIKKNEGLSKSRYGVVIISEYFFSKKWTQNELSALFMKEETRGKVILPVLHGVDYQYVVNNAPMLASKIAASTSDGLDNVAEKIFEAVKPYLILLTNTDIEVIRDQIKWRRFHEGSYLNQDPLISILEKVEQFDNWEFYKCNLNDTELKLLLKISKENEKYVSRYDYGPMPVADSKKLREEKLNPILALIDKLRYIIKVKENK